MKIYINTDTQPPSVAASLKVSTDATGTLRVYSASAASSVSSFKFKRGTTVPVEAVFADADAAAKVAKLRFGIKLSGKYDDVLVVAAETTERVENDDGTVSFHLKLTLDAAVIDTVLGVNGDSTDDIATANFISEIEWENADGEITATETVSTVIQNNVVRGTAAASGTTAGAWTALMVIRMSWAEFSALEERNPDAIYIVADAPDPVEEHNANPDAHAETLAALSDNLTAAFDAKLENAQAEIDGNTDALRDLSQRSSTIEETLAQIPVPYPTASDTQAGTVKTGGNGITAPNGVLTLSVRDTHSGLDFENKKLHVAAGTNLHPRAGATLPAGTDYAGKLCVPALPAASPVLVRTVLASGAYIGTADKVMHATIDNNGTFRAFFGTLGELIRLSSDAGTQQIFPTAITVYRRSNDAATNHSNGRFLRIIRKDDAGDWRVAFESINTIAVNDYAENDAMTWELINIDGKGAIPSDEEIAVVQTPDPTSIATDTRAFGAKTTSEIQGGITAGAELAAANRLAFSPALDVAFYTLESVPAASQVVSLEDFNAFAASMVEAHTALAARITALETKA